MSPAQAPRVLVVGAGLAGLVAAVAASRAGADVLVLERDDEPGGATAASAGWVWRYRDAATAGACAPRGDLAVHAAVLRGLDESLGWLESRGVRLLTRDTRRAITRGARIDPAQALDVLAAQLGDERIQVRSVVRDARRRSDGRLELNVLRGRVGALADDGDVWLEADAVVFAGGGYAADLARVATDAGLPPDAAASWVLRAPRGGDGSSLDAAARIGALRVRDGGECMVRLATASSGEGAAVQLGELLVPAATLTDSRGHVITAEPHDWSGAQRAWQLARSGGVGRLELPRANLRDELHAGTVEDALRTAIRAGAANGRTADGGVWIEVVAGITHTRCGLRIDPDGRLVEPHVTRIRRASRERPISGAYAAGMDAADVGLGGTASGLAQALVVGRRAGTLAAGVQP